MFQKHEILIIIFTLLIIFYLVISLGAGKKGKNDSSPQIKSYLFSVRVLISIIAIVAFILWNFI